MESMTSNFGLILGTFFGMVIIRMIFANLFKLKKPQYFFFFYLIGLPLFFFSTLIDENGDYSLSNLSTSDLFTSIIILVGTFLLPFYDKELLKEETFNDSLSLKIYYVSKRFIAAAIDMVCILVLVFLINWSLMTILAQSLNSSDVSILMLFNIIVFILVPATYIILCDKYGWSLGKKIMKLQLESLSQPQKYIITIVFRYLLKFLLLPLTITIVLVNNLNLPLAMAYSCFLMILFLYGTLGMVTIFFSRNNQTWYDQILKQKVI